MSEYRLTWLQGRSTPVVTKVGAQRRKTAGGKVVASRLATEQEKTDIRAGRWVRSRPPGQPNKQSSIRPQLTKDARPKTLYVYRPVINGAPIIRHYKAQGITGLLDASDLHVTVAYSRQPLDWMKVSATWQEKVEIPTGGPRTHEMLGTDSDALVLLVSPFDLKWRHDQILEAGASWDWPDYQPHITIAYDRNIDMTDVDVYQGKITLGPEVFEELDPDWKAKVTNG
ncbi:MAG: hypothetical protein AAFZ46_09245 [Pseudomonadota bacterium]